MTAPLRRTVNDLVTEIRDDLDESVNAATNFWTNAFLVARLNRGLREVWQTARETQENWFTRKLASSDPPLTLYGRSYDPQQFQLVAGRDELKLPPDCFQVLAIVAMPTTTDDIDPLTSLVFSDLAHEDFRTLRKETGGSIGARHYLDLEWRGDGPWLVVAPVIGLATATDVELHYVYQPRDYVLDATTNTVLDPSLEQSGFSDTMLDAVIAYVVLEAREKEGHATDIQLATSKYARKLALVTRHAGPRETQDPEVVQGFLEEWI